jgi:hypothetical protein
VEEVGVRDVEGGEVGGGREVAGELGGGAVDGCGELGEVEDIQGASLVSSFVHLLLLRLSSGKVRFYALGES